MTQLSKFMGKNKSNGIMKRERNMNSQCDQKCQWVHLECEHKCESPCISS
uniref:Uncharacterized protein n=1 Tax=Nelumbo nucifera TaxID=4432 RepID=A0A822YJ02_NELNU|nr:TPA_asm: hypothetical protein HUJ06_010341 [Nelumbo nucifera]